MIRIATLSLVSTLAVAGSATADIVNLGGTAPAADIIDEQTTTNSFTRTFDINANSNTRGEFFSTGDNALAGGTQFDIDSIVIRKNVAQTYGAGSTLTLYIWQGSVADWSAGDGSANHTELEIFDTTTVTQIHTEVFDLEGAFGNGNYLSLDLGTDVLVDENSDFGFLVVYSAGTVATDPTYFQLGEAVLAAVGHEGQARSTDADNFQTASRQLTFAVVGTAVPEPGSLALLGLGGLLIARRRRG